MCLYSSTNIPSIAEDDIIVYKVLECFRTCRGNLYMTPYMHQKVDIDEPHRPEESVDYTHKSSYNPIDSSIIAYRISNGYIHCYSNEPEYWRRRYNYKLFKCKIPKGTKYYKDYLINTICAEEIIYIKEVE